MGRINWIIKKLSPATLNFWLLWVTRKEEKLPTIKNEIAWSDGLNIIITKFCLQSCKSFSLANTFLCHNFTNLDNPLSLLGLLVQMRLNVCMINVCTEYFSCVLPVCVCMHIFLNEVHSAWSPSALLQSTFIKYFYFKVWIN